jgi:thiosulfate dehydrogenase [quinone] large subunit
MRQGDRPQKPQLPTQANTATTRAILNMPGAAAAHVSESSTASAGWVMLPLRLFLGGTFVYAGVQKLTDPQFFHQATPGYIGKQIAAFAHGSPLHNVLISLVLPHAVAFGWLIALGEIAIGIGALCGLFFRLAAFCGLLLSFIFFLTASWHVYPYFYGADIVFVFCWLTLLLNGTRYTGLPAVDTRLAKVLAHSGVYDRHSQLAPLLALLLGSTAQDQPSPVAVASRERTTSPGYVRPRNTNATRRKKEARRHFLLGAVTGGASIFVLTMISYLLRSTILHDSENSQAANVQAASVGTSTTGSAQTSTTTGAQAATVITHVSAVPQNSSFDFTIPATGDPGILIHLSNDQFVAYDAVCTHAGCQVGYDTISQHLVCPCHGAEFDPAQNAAVLQGPAPTPLTPVMISINSTTGAITLK